LVPSSRRESRGTTRLTVSSATSETAMAVAGWLLTGRSIRGRDLATKRKERKSNRIVNTVATKLLLSE